MRQKTWEVWFISSLIVFSVLFFVGTVEGSAEVFPNLLWGLVPSFINIAVCLYYGSKPNK